MALTVEIGDGKERVEARDRTLFTAKRFVVPTEKECSFLKLFSGNFSDANGSIAMAVDGSTTPVVFQCKAESGAGAGIRAVESCRLVFHSTNMDITTSDSRRFGPTSAPGLANGISFKAFQGGVETKVFLKPVKVIGEFYRHAGGGLMPPGSAIISDINSIANNTDLLLIAIHFTVRVCLYPQTKDRLEIVISDDLTGLDLFETQVYGTLVEIE